MGGRLDSPDGGGRANAGALGGAQARGMAAQATTAGPPAGYSITGIDVSSHDHSKYPIDWPGVAASGVKFAYVKATEGQFYTNPYFHADNRDAKAAGLLTGAYAFGRPDLRDPIGEADYFIDHAEWVNDSQTLVPFLDMEWPYSALNLPTCYGLTQSEMVGWIRSFVEQVRMRTGRAMMIYTAASWWNTCTGNTTSFGGNPLDVAYWSSTPPSSLPSGWNTFTVWQYAGGDNSVAGNYDKDVFNGDYTALTQLAGKPLRSPRKIVDFNNDGNVDIAGIDANSNLQLYTGNGTAKLSGSGPMWPTGGLWAGFKHIVAADFNNDGNVDIAGIDAYNDLRLYVGGGSGKLTGGGTAMWPTGGLWGGFKHIVAADFNNDGNVDIAGIDAYNDLRLYVGGGSGKLTGGGTAMWPTGGLWGGFKHIEAGDFNNDGNVDIAGIDAYNDLRLYVGGGSGKLTGGGTAMWPTGGLWGGFKHIVAGDFNNDGNVDIAGIDAYNDMRMYTGDGTGTLPGGGGPMWPTGGRWAGFKHIT